MVIKNSSSSLKATTTTTTKIITIIFTVRNINSNNNNNNNNNFDCDFKLLNFLHLYSGTNYANIYLYLDIYNHRK